MVQGGTVPFPCGNGSSCRNCKSSTIDPKMVIPGAAVWGTMELAQQRQDPTARGLWRLNHLPPLGFLRDLIWPPSYCTVLNSKYSTVSN
jgi:hypothetical protein